MHTILQILFTLIGIPLLLLLIIVAKIVGIIVAVPLAGLFLILGSENPLFNEEDIIGTYTLEEYNDNDSKECFIPELKGYYLDIDKFQKCYKNCN